MSKQNSPKVDLSNQQNSSFYNSYIEGKEFYYLIGVILSICFIVFNDFIFLKKIYLFKDIGSDSLNAVWPYMVQAVDSISSGNFLSWSFNFGMGQNASSYVFYDPFNVFLFIIGKEDMIYFIAFREILKILLASMFFYKYLKLLNFNNYIGLIGAVIYGFTGYMILGGSGWYIFSFEAFNMAFLLWSFEQFFQKNKWYWLPIPIFLICVSRPFNLWMFGVFIGIYMILRIYQTQNKLNYRSIGIMIAKILGLVTLGIGLSGPFFFEHLQVMIDSPRVSGPDSYFSVLSSAPMFATPDKMQFGTEIMRFFSSDILGSGLKFKGWQNFMEAPMFYVGLISLLLFPQVFQFLDKRVKRISIIILLIWMLPIVFPYFRQAFSLFSGDYYRAYSFFVALIILVFALMAFNFMFTQKTINLKLLIITLVSLLILVNYPFFKDKSTVDSSLLISVILFLITYSFLIYNIVVKKDNKTYMIVLLLCLVCELSYFSWCTVNRRDHVTTKDLSKKIGYNDYSVEAVNYIKQIDQSFYRIDKSYFSSPAIHGSLNDAMVHNYYGTSCYNSFNQKNYINYFKTLGVISKVNESESRWAPGLINRFILESLNGVKYVLTKNTNNPIWINSFDSIAKFGDVVVLKNKNVLPIGFTYDKYVKLSDFDKLGQMQKDLVSTKACVLNDEDVSNYNKMSLYNLKDTLPLNSLSFEIIKNNFDSLKLNVFKITSFSQTNIKGNVNIDKSKMLYLSIPFDDGWAINENGKPLNKVILSNGMTGLFLDPGNHNLELIYTSANMKKGSIILIISVLVFLVLLAYTKFKNVKIQNS
jgi:uncharacterized membrane protein YfhO